MDIRHLEHFLAVAEELNFGRAAKRLNISQPPLSKQIKELEEELGVELFKRGPKGVSITPAGTYLAGETLRILGRLKLVRQRIRKIGDEGTRLVRVGFVASAMYSFLPELVAKYQEELPRLVFSFVELPTNAQGSMLLKGEIDIGFVRSWIDEDGIKFKALATESLSLVRSERMTPAEDTGALERYRDLPFIAFSKSGAPGIADQALQACARAGFVPHSIFTAEQFDSVLRLVAAGLGWSIVPTSALSGLRLDLRSNELPGPTDRIEIGVALRADEDDPVLMSLLEIADRHFSAGRKGITPINPPKPSR